jgi:RNA polymerase sigma factor (sigma-70 family)
VQPQTLEKFDSGMSDHEVLMRIREDRDLNAAILSLYQQYAETVYGYIRNNGGNKEDSEDIFQETVLSFLKLVKAEKFRGDASIKTFLVSIARNLWMKEWNKRHNADKRNKTYERAQETVDAGVADLLQQQEVQKQMRSLLSRLDDGCQQLLIAHYYEGVPLKDLVVKLGFANEQVVRNKKYKCMKTLTDLIRDAKMDAG